MTNSTTSPSVNPTLILSDNSPDAAVQASFAQAVKLQAIHRAFRAETLRHRAELMALRVQAELAGDALLAEELDQALADSAPRGWSVSRCNPNPPGSGRW